MTASEQNGIDILCDAAGSDMLLSSLFSLASPSQQSQHLQQQPQSLEQDQQQSLRHQTPRSQSSSLPSKRKLSDATPSSPSHVCQICKRVYERADHLTRHLRSHENARPYQCSRCPKRFNRADLLTRHETTHDRDGGSKGRPFIRRSDRAAEACLNCAASKAKCEDQKPCSRCRNKSLTCEMPPRRGQQYRTSDGLVMESSSETSTMASIPGIEPTGFLPNDGLYGLSKSSQSLDQPMDPIATFQSPLFANPSGPPYIPTTDMLADDFMFFNPTQSLFQDMDFSLDLDLKEPTDPWSRIQWASSPRYISSILGSSSHPDFKLSAWIFEPEGADFAQHGVDNLTHLSMDTPNPSLLKPTQDLDRFKMTSAARDRVFAMVLTQTLKQKRPAAFPSLDILNHFLQAHLTREEARCESLIHIPSFDPERARPELLCAIVSSGAAQVSAATAWKFGLALDDVTHLAMGELIEKSTRINWDLTMLQVFMLHLDIGQWSGFKRKMEAAESSAQALLTILRRSGKTTFSTEQTTQIPLISDPPAVLQLKWRQFITRESYKRLVMRLFFHDVQSSIGLSKNPSMSFNELDFSLPATQDLWRARSADEWRDIMLSKRPAPSAEMIPRVAELFQSTTILSELDDRVDIELCYMAMIYGFWGQICSYRDAIRFHRAGDYKIGEASTPLWLKTQYQELYRKLGEFKTLIRGGSHPELVFLVEVFFMALHVSVDDLHRISGRNGEEALRKATKSLHGPWISGSESWHAVWHAGQVLRYARTRPPTSLQGFNALAVYLAGLTLWVYGTASPPPSQPGRADGSTLSSEPFDLFSTDGKESEESRSFLQLGRGTPGLTIHEGSDKGIKPLTNSGVVLTMFQEVLRNNFPILQEPVPPFVESLQLHLDGLRTMSLAQAMTDTIQSTATS